MVDVGCGEGSLARELRALVPEVVAIDRDQPILDLARSQDPANEVDFVLGDFLTYPFEPDSFDAVVSIAALDHMDAEAGLAHMALLVRPGGVVVVVGLARSRRPGDFMVDGVAVVVSRLIRLARGHWDQPAPTVWPPPTSYRQIRVIAQRVLPGVRYRRHLFFRYSLTWTKPRS